jgi:hypothetical protein
MELTQTFTSPLPALGFGGVIDTSEWSSFLDAVSGELAGSPVAIEVASPGQPRVVMARGVLHSLLYDARGDVIEVAVQIPAPGRISVLRHVISGPMGVASDSTKGILPSLLVMEDSNGEVTRLRLLPSPAFGG